VSTVKSHMLCTASLTLANSSPAAERALDASEVPQEELGNAAELRQYLQGVGGGSAFRVWISKETLRVLKMEVEYPSVEEPPNEPPTQVRTSVFDYEKPVDVPEEPLSMSHEEAERLRYIAESGAGVVRQAADGYRAEHQVFPSQLDETALSSYLDPNAAVINPISGEQIELDENGWPVNPFSNEPMRQTLTGSPGDFFYEVKDGGRDYGICLYGWDGTLSETGAPVCPEVQ